MERYIENNYICKGATIIHHTDNTVIQIARFSDNYNPLKSLHIRNIYQYEILDICEIGSYMVLWQLFQTANVLQNPIRSIYPTQGNNTIRRDINRRMWCFHDTWNSKSPINIIWMPMQIKNSRPCHFVQLLKVVRLKYM